MVRTPVESDRGSPWTGLRRRWAPGPGHALLGLLLMLLPGVPTATAAQVVGLGTIHGRVIEVDVERPVANAFIDILDSEGEIRKRARTDSLGYFTVSNLIPGSFKIRVRSVGYAETTTPQWGLESYDQVTLIVRVHPEAVLLAPLEVVAHARSVSPVLTGFYSRMNRVSGTFITADQIAESNATRVTDLMVTIPGVRVVGNSMGLITIMERALAYCPAQVWIDGMLASRGGPVAIDDLVGPELLVGIEVYKGLASVPPEFYNEGARCGVIALWTQRGG